MSEKTSKSMSLGWVALLAASAVFLVLVWWWSQPGEVVVPPSEPAVVVASPEKRPAPPREEDVPQAAPVAAPIVDAPAVPPGALNAMPRHPVDADALSREATLLERMKAEAKSDPELALRSLGEYRRLFPEPQVPREAELVRLEALLRLGRRTEAETVARKLTSKDAAAKKIVRRMLEDVRPN